MTEILSSSSTPIIRVPTALSGGLEASELHQIGEILQRNVNSGRVKHVLKFSGSDEQALSLQDEDSSELSQDGISDQASDDKCDNAVETVDIAIPPPKYIARVVAIYRQESNNIRRLKGGDEDAWQQLHGKLREVALRILLGMNVDYEEAEDKAHDYAQIACGKILTATFPFDVEFRFWCARILRNAILEDRRSKENRLETLRIVDSLDRLVESNDSFSVAPLYELSQHDLRSLIERPELEQWELVRTAIDRIKSKARRLVIQYSYFDGLEDREIAVALARSVNAIYGLRSQALRQLREILATMGVTDYE